MKAAAGLAIVGAHIVAFALAAQRCRGEDLVVTVHAASAAPAVAIEGDVPPSLADRVTTSFADAPPGPGLQRKRWSVAYRGGYERAVGAAQLVGPFQDPAAHACTGRVVVTQRLLDDGVAGAATIAGQMKLVLERELAGESVTGAGAYTGIAAIALRWARVEWHPDDRAMVGEAPHGYVRAAVTIAFERVTVPVVIALIPTPTPASLPAPAPIPAPSPASPGAPPDVTFRVASRAELAFGNRVAQWISDHLGGNALATRLARDQIDGALISALAPPPPFELGDGQTLRFTYCAEPPEIVEGVSGALPFSVELGTAHDPAIRPPRRGRAPRLAPARDAQLALDLDLDALNALLYELWRDGFLDRALASAGLDARFNADPLVQELLSLRISPVTLALPPVIAPAGDRLRLSADARITIRDGASATLGRVWGGLDLRARGDALVPGEPRAATTPPAATAPPDATAPRAATTPPAATAPPDAAAASWLAVDLGALELSCERAPSVLAPCYADLVAAIRDRGSEFHGALTDAFAQLLRDLFVERHLGASGLPAELVIQRAVPRITAGDGNASLHLDLAASLVPALH